MTKEAINYVSEIGEAIYPHLNKPDVRFNEAGEYKVTLKIPEAKAKGMIAQIEKTIEASISDAEAKTGKKVKVAPKLYSIENGFAFFKFKMKATGVNRKTKESFSQRPILYDAKKNPIDPSSLSIWGGSKLKVAYTLRPYYTPVIGAGVVGQMKAVQVIELVEGNKPQQLDLFSKEDGFETTKKPTEKSDVQAEIQASTDF